MAKPLRVLIVEDSMDDTKLLLRELRRGGYDPAFERVDTSEDMHEALEKQSWDIVIADYVMPSFSGLTALELLKEEGFDLPFILVSGQIDEGSVVTAMEAGAGGFVSKGNLARLVPAVERELRDAQVQRERREAEAKLKQVAEKYEAILRIALDGFWIADTQGHLLEVNEAYCRMVGYSRNELLNMRIRDVEAVEEPEDTARHVLSVIETGLDRFETRHRREDGTIIDLEVSVNYLAGDSDRLFAFLRNITERKRAEAEREQMLEEIRDVNQQLLISSARQQETAREAQQRTAELQGILDNMVDAVYVLYISNEIVKRHGGRMWFESRVPPGRGRGSTLWVSLPTAPAEGGVPSFVEGQAAPSVGFD